MGLMQWIRSARLPPPREAEVFACDWPLDPPARRRGWSAGTSLYWMPIPSEADTAAWARSWEADPPGSLPVLAWDSHQGRVAVVHPVAVRTYSLRYLRWHPLPLIPDSAPRLPLVAPPEPYGQADAG